MFGLNFYGDLVSGSFLREVNNPSLHPSFSWYSIHSTFVSILHWGQEARRNDDGDVKFLEYWLETIYCEDNELGKFVSRHQFKWYVNWHLLWEILQYNVKQVEKTSKFGFHFGQG